MKESIVRHLLVIGYVKTKIAIRPGQELQILREPLSPDNVCHAGKEITCMDYEHIIRLKFIAPFDKVKSTIKSIIDILKPNDIEKQEWFQIEATQIMPD